MSIDIPVTCLEIIQYIYILIHIYIYTYTHTHIYILMYIYTSLKIYRLTYVYTYVWMKAWIRWVDVVTHTHTLSMHTLLDLRMLDIRRYIRMYGDVSMHTLR